MNLPFVFSQKMSLRRNRWLLKDLWLQQLVFSYLSQCILLKTMSSKLTDIFGILLLPFPVINKKNGIVFTKCQVLLYPTVISYEYWLALHHIISHCGFLFTMNKKNYLNQIWWLLELKSFITMCVMKLGIFLLIKICIDFVFFFSFRF